MTPFPSPHRLHRVALAVTLLGLVALLAPVRQDATLQWLFNLAHVPGFALLAMLWAEDLMARDWSRRRRLGVVASVGLLVAAATETLQMLVPGRYADLDDMLRNALGLAIGLGLHLAWPGLLASRVGRE